MNELMNKIMAFRSEVDDVWKTPNTLDCLRYAAQEANELRDLWMRQQNPGHARHNERDESMAQELADTVIMLLSAGIGPPLVQFILPVSSDMVMEVADGLCLNVEKLIHEKRAKKEVLNTCLIMCSTIAHHLDVTLDDIVKDRLKDIARRNGFDVGIVDEVWNGDE